jgi:hypothetical protein
MDAQRSSQLNRLLLSLPEGFLADSAWLQAQGLSRSSIRDYVDRGWLERIGSRVCRRPSQLTKASLRWDVVVLSLQRVMHKPLHVGGQTAVELSGYAHYVEAGRTPRVYLYGSGLPSWLTKLPLSAQLETRSSGLRIETHRLFGFDLRWVLLPRRFAKRSPIASSPTAPTRTERSSWFVKETPRSKSKSLPFSGVQSILSSSRLSDPS